MMAIVLEHFFWDTLQSMFDGSDMWRCELVSRHWMAGTNLWPIAEPMPVGWGAAGRLRRQGLPIAET